MQVIGNIGKTPEFRQGGKNNTTYVRFTFCENHTGKDYDGPEIPPTWYECTAFPNPETELLLQKGNFLRLTGRLEPNIYYSRDDVNKETPLVSLRFTVNKIEAMPRRGESAGSAGSGRSSAPAPAPSEQAPRPPRQAPSPAQAPARAPVAQQSGGFDDMDDDIPF